MVVLAERDAAHQGDVVFQPRSATDADFRADNAKGTDLDIAIEFGARIYNR